MDFLKIDSKHHSRGESYYEVYPKFYVVDEPNELMTRGKQFYAIYDPNDHLWKMKERYAIELIDAEMNKYAADLQKKYPDDKIEIKYMKDASSGSLDKFHKLVQIQMEADVSHDLNSKLIFANQSVRKTDYASFKLPYSLENGDYSAWDELVSVLYDPEERHKIEWAIGTIVNGASKKMQKFYVFYGKGGTGKSTILNIIQGMFEGYYTTFDAASLGNMQKQFAFAPFADNPLIGIQHDGDLSKINDNTRLNMLISHESIDVDQKFKQPINIKHPITTLFMGSNTPVKITDAKSGLIRRLIDINPSNRKIPRKHYNELMDSIKFEYGAIAYHCKEVFEDDPHYYDDYQSKEMMEETNDLYNYMLDQYDELCNSDEVTLRVEWTKYKDYCEDANVNNKLTMKTFKSELKDYFKEYSERGIDSNGKRQYKLFKGFKHELFEATPVKSKKDELPTSKKKESWLSFKEQHSLLDDILKDCPAQYAVEDEESGQIRPQYKWVNCKTKLKDIDTSKLHYVKSPEQLIIIDFDIKDETGSKSFEKNLESASKWPKTYAELSKSGSGIHLHYYYDGDISKLSNIYDENVEIKVFPDDKNSALRRKVTKCNDIPIAHINSGLPQKEVKKRMVNGDAVKSEKGLRKLIERNLNKEIHPATKPSVDFIYKILDDAYNSGLQYDVSDMKQAVLYFAGNSTHQAGYCMDLVSKMRFKSDDISPVPDSVYDDGNTFTFFDIEVFPNLLLVCYLPVSKQTIQDLVDLLDKEKKAASEGKKFIAKRYHADFIEKLENIRGGVQSMINPSPDDISNLARMKLIGFNCRRYDNHVLYGRMSGYSTKQCYNLSQNIVNKVGNPFFGSAYDMSFTDVYDFSAKKQSLKKFEIELGMYHQENEYPWDKDLDESHWAEVESYCKNDVLATVGTFCARYGDYVAREILSALSGLNMNATTNMHTTRIIFGKNKNPGLVYTDLRTGKQYGPGEKFDMPVISEDEYMKVKDDWKSQTAPHGNCFPGYFLVKGNDGKFHNMYRGVDLSFGGYVYASPGMYLDGAQTEDVASEHPHSIKELNLFGEYTQNFIDLMDARIFIKHKDYDKAKTLFGGKLAPYLDDPAMAKALSGALKIAINSVYGLTSASFANAFRDSRNINNIVALRGALFMKTVQDAVEERGYHVIHIKTDSIKIEHPDDVIIRFVEDLGKNFGYTFEVEHTWDRICLVNNAVFIGRHGKDDPDSPLEWDAVGTQFQIPYIFKSLFSHEPISFSDMCETKTVNTAMYLDFNEGLTRTPALEKVEKLRRSKKKMTKSEEKLLEEFSSMTDEQLKAEIGKGHNMQFVGKVGLFCPIKPGCGGGELLRQGTDRYGNETFNAATGAKWIEDGKEVNRWLEASVVKELNKEGDIDKTYYRNLVDDAIATIEQFGSFEQFADVGTKDKVVAM